MYSMHMYVCVCLCEDRYCLQNVNGLHKIWSSACLKCDQSFGQQKQQFLTLYVSVCVCVFECVWVSVSGALVSWTKQRIVFTFEFRMNHLIFVLVCCFFVSLFCFSAFSLINCLPPSSLPWREKWNQFGSKTQLISRILHLSRAPSLSVLLSVTLFLYVFLFSLYASSIENRTGKDTEWSISGALVTLDKP